MPRPLRVFLCHASQDKPAVRKLHRYLKQRGVQPWLDELDLLPGEHWEVEIPNALFSSDVILVCLSKNSVDKEGYVQKEITFALDKAQEKPEGAIFIIPVKLEECDIPKRLNRYQWVDLFRADGYKRLMLGLDKRAIGLGSDVARVLTMDETRTKPVSQIVFTQPEPEKIDLQKVAQEAREKAEREAIEKDAREKLEFEAAEKAKREKAEQEAAEIAARVKAEREAAEKAAREKREREARERAKREKDEREAKEKIAHEAKPAPSAPSPFGRGQGEGKRLLGIGGIILLVLILGGFGLSYLLQNLPVATATTSPKATSTSERPTATSVPFTPTPLPPETPVPTPTLGSGSTMIGEKGETLVYVPAGEFTMGSDVSSDEKPVHTVYLDAFWIDQTEVTNKQYKACVDAGTCEPPSSTSSYTHPNYYGNPEFDDYPVIYVNWDKANRYCEVWTGTGGDLPTEAQWEKAARGTDARIYPWGDDAPNKDLLNYNGNVGDTTKVGSYENVKTFYGTYDMAGNVWEWVNDWYGETYYQSSNSSNNPLGPESGQYRVLRGGSWSYLIVNVRSAYRFRYSPVNPGNLFGFRCARSQP